MREIVFENVSNDLNIDLRNLGLTYSQKFVSEEHSSALEVCYENALYKFTFDIDIDAPEPGPEGPKFEAGSTLATHCPSPQVRVSGEL